MLEEQGRVRIVVPDGEKWLEAYVTGDPEKWEELGCEDLPDDMPTEMSMINHVFHQDGEHKFIYDFETLYIHLKRAGFKNVNKMSYGESEDEELCLDSKKHAPYSLYVEAEK